MCRLEHKYQLELVGAISMRKYLFSINRGKDIDPFHVANIVREGGLFELDFVATVASADEGISIFLVFPSSRQGLTAVVDPVYHISGSPRSLDPERY
jgi:hypothetical protein